MVSAQASVNVRLFYALTCQLNATMLSRSNWPVSERAGTYTRGIQIVKAYFAGKGEAAREKFFWRNSQELYKWQER